MSFLPQDYQAPKSNSGYLKIQDGETKVRILSRPIIGWEDWDNKKPVRFKFENKPTTQFDPKKQVRHFWSMIAWNYNEEQIQILHLTQRSIQNKIQALDNDKDWGPLYFYDIKIIKTGQGIDTEYDVNPLPHKDLNPAIEEAFHEKPCNLEALFDGGDPFSREWRTYTEGVFKKEEGKKDAPTNNQLDELHSILSGCSEDYQKEVQTSLGKMGKKMSELDSNLYNRVLTAAKKKRDEFLAANNEDVPF